MSYEFYKILHLLGLALTLLSFGGILMFAMNGGTKATNQFKKGVMISHGVGLLLLLVAGFGMLAKMGIHGLPTWAILKLVIWLAFGGLIAVAYKQRLASRLWLVIPVLVAWATYLAQSKPQ
jgi:uncharacterized membrane protein SirB2